MESANCPTATNVIVCREALDPFFIRIKNDCQSASQYFALTDQNIHALYGKWMEAQGFPLLALPPGERSKSLLSANRCWEEMIRRGLDRSSCLLAIGGGTITDIGGFAASAYMRGITAVFIPTTLLGMVDACIGGKTGVNLAEGKNLIGTFHTPKTVYINPLFLTTLPQREYVSGLAEVVKYGVIKDPWLLGYLEDNIPALLHRDAETLELVVRRSLAIKQGVIAKDPKDQGERAILNWGHTFAHALETLTEYQTYTHGEAVAIGMNMAAKVSLKLGLCRHPFVGRQQQLLKQLGLPTEVELSSLDRLLDLMAKDKKAEQGALTMILARDFGNVFKLNGISRATVLEALAERPLV